MPHCSLCESDNVKALWQVGGADCRLYRCLDCTGSFLLPQPTDSFLRDLYSKSYYDAWGIRDDVDLVREMKLSTFRLRLDLIRKFRRGGKILDVGCAVGFFLEAASEAGFVPFGVEFSGYSSKIAKEKFGDEAVFAGVLEQSPFPEQSFDVIAMSDLLEHVRDPHAMLEKSRSLLTDGGILMVMTPDTGSLTHLLMGKNWVHYKIEHLFYFNRKSLRYLAELHGFRVLHQEAARKTLTIAYLYHQFLTYRHWLFTPIFSLLHALLPRKVLQGNFNVTIGEMVLVLEKRPPGEPFPP